MNNLNRPLIKQQAKALVKPELFKLFLISLIVMLLTGSGGLNISRNIDFNDHDYNFYDKGSNDYYDFDDYYYNYDFDDFYNDHQEGAEDNPFNNFNPTASTESGKIITVDKVSEFDAVEDAFEDAFKDIFKTFGSLGKIVMLGAAFSVIVSLIFSPLQVTEAGIYLTLIRRRPGENFSLGDQLRRLFKESFNSNYIKKLGLIVLRELVTVLLMLCFIVPGIIYMYSTRFALQLMSDNPDLSPTEALKLSRKMNTGHRTELFILDLSLIPWILLIVITLGLASIYTTPYFKVIEALYYENFKLRALANGTISADEVTPKTNAENNFFGGQNNYYYGNAQENQQNSYYQPQQSSEHNFYNHPQQNNQPQPDYYNAPENSAGYYSPDSNNKTEEYKPVTEENSTSSYDNDEPTDYSSIFKD